MSNNWPKVKLGDLLEHRKEFVTIDDLKTYRRPRVQLHAQGIVLRDELPGALIKTKEQQICRAGEFLVAEIDAKVGGYGIVPEFLDGCIVSSHYFLFVVDPTRLDRNFLDYFTRTPTFGDQVAAQGSTNYAAIRPSHVLNYEIPLPQLATQRRIVARIEELTAKIEEARELRKQGAQEREALVAAHLRTAFESATEQYGPTRLEGLIAEACYGSSEKCSRERNDGAVAVLRIPNVASEQIELDDLKFALLSATDRQRLLLRDGDILVVRTNGSLNLVGRSAVVNGLSEEMAFASYMIRLRLDPDRILPAYAQRMLRHLRLSGQLIDFARTTAGQYNVSLGRLRSADIPVPPILEQRRIIAHLDELQEKTDALRRLQAEASVEVNALTPSILDKAFRGEL
jgi:type I restriction enzyme, S subunit